jgi:hypothetical protein
MLAAAQAAGREFPEAYIPIQCRPGYLLNAGVAVDSFAVAVIG